MKLPGHHRLGAARIWPLSLFLLLALLLTACGGASPAPTITLVPTLNIVIPPTPERTATPILPDAPGGGNYPAPELPSAAPTQAPTNPAAYPAPGTPLPALAPAISFDGQRAFRDLEYQLSLGPRTPGSDAHAKLIEWMQSELTKNGWTVELQETTQNNQPVRNVIAKRGSGKPWAIVGAHFDSRMQADQDPDPARRSEAVAGANDGASGVAVLMELSRSLPADLKGETWLAFFDSEDQGNLPGWDWILGSRALSASLTAKPDAVIVVDMIGDADLKIPKERSSNPNLTTQLWDTAARLGHGGIFLDQPGFNMLDDHTPFLQKGIPAVDIIDFEYPHWHTTADTLDKVSAESLKVVGETVGTWLVLRE